EDGIRDFHVTGVQTCALPICAALVLAPPVDVGRVEEVQTGVERRVHDGVAVGLVGLRTEVHRPEDEAADLESRASELRVLHDSPPSVLECAPCKGIRHGGTGPSAA